MDFDCSDTPQAERLLRLGAGRRHLKARRAAITEASFAALVLFGVVALAWAGQPFAHTTLLSAIVVVGVFLICERVRFPVGPVFTEPTQLAFVPMLMLLPTGLVPAVVIGCRLAPLLISRREQKLTAVGVMASIADCAYTLGPVCVLILAGHHSFAWSHWPVYAAAMAAQISVDLTCGLARSWFAERIPPREQVPVLAWLYMTDICLTCTALFVNASAQRHHGLVLLELPLVGLIAMFARERKLRMESSMALSSTVRGTATLLGDVIEDDDAYTGIHSREVADLALSVALRLELNAVELFNVEYGALLHDVGKLRVPKAILLKPGKLTPEEWKIMREHTVAGEQMLCMVGGSLSSIGRIVRHSHERFDGSGYPDGLAREAIPVASRIVSACDAWNAMTTSRPYRRALSVELAADEMKRCAGTHFDPIVLDALLREVAGPPYCDGVLEAAAGRRSSGTVQI
jgi:HD-GYP domain-containing protein (c-di-GMP phosphodiesterase class II)